MFLLYRLSHNKPKQNSLSLFSGKKIIPDQLLKVCKGEFSDHFTDIKMTLYFGPYTPEEHLSTERKKLL